jgi:hypothetical protein
MLEPSDPKWDEFHDAQIVDWKRVRSSIEHENTLTNHRLTWLLTSQGFLFAAFALVFEASTKNDVAAESRDFYKLILAGLAFTGILVSAFLRLSLRAAQVQHDRLRDWWQSRPGTDHSRHPAICGTEFGWLTSNLPHHFFPYVFQFSWLFFIAAVLWNNLKSYARPLGVGALIIVGALGLVVLGIIIGRRTPRPSRGVRPGP